MKYFGAFFFACLVIGMVFLLGVSAYDLGCSVGSAWYGLLVPAGAFAFLFVVVALIDFFDWINE